MASAFILAGAGRLNHRYPQLPHMGIDASMVPPNLLKAIAWVESGWSQFDGSGAPLLSYGFGYGAMQITSGMPGAFGYPMGTLPLSVQSRVGGSYSYNIAMGARMLAQAFESTPAINDRDPTAVEDWYYAVWAYNSWGYVNNPNNPGYSRDGTPASDPGNFPYQERVYYWLSHPPKGANGRPLWKATRVTLPDPKLIGDNPGPLYLSQAHRQVPHVFTATYDGPGDLTAMNARGSIDAHVRVYNAGAEPWLPSGDNADALMYHWVIPGHHQSPRFDRHLGGIDIYDSGPVFLSSPVNVGESVLLPVHVTAPPSSGRLGLEFDMVNRVAGWFSYNGAEPGYQPVTVVASGAPSYTEPVPNVLQGRHAWPVTLTSASVPATLKPNQAYRETVLWFNPGSVSWKRGYHLRLLGSSTTEAPSMPFVAPCRTVPLTISGTAPSKPGAYVAKWQLESPTGQIFGKPVAISFDVVKRT